MFGKCGNSYKSRDFISQTLGRNNVHVWKMRELLQLRDFINQTLGRNNAHVWKTIKQLPKDPNRF